MEVQYENLKEDVLPIRVINHLEVYCGNAKQSSYFYRQALGFSLVAYAGPETGMRDKVSYVLQQDRIRIILTTPIVADSPINDFLVRHGDSVKDVAFDCSDAELCYKATTAKGARGVMEPRVISDENGSIKVASVATYGDTIHTFVENVDYKGVFMPGYQATKPDTMARPVGLKYVDHVVGNVGWDQMNSTVEFYQKVFGFSRFVSFDDKDISTEYSALRSTVMSNASKWIKMPINEPAEALRKSQIEEYITFHNGPGVQHIAMLTDDIVDTVTKMKAQGVEFLEVPSAYYDSLLDRVGPIDEQMEKLAEAKILVDRDEKGYMLQLFTKPIEDRPTLFLEIIQRKGGESFGKGNFKALFEAIEREQDRRGNL